MMLQELCPQHHFDMFIVCFITLPFLFVFHFLTCIPFVFLFYTDNKIL